jgi:sugar O-acyltransferase (sialic acid O-acetyltransferase NeuD family)
VSYRVAVVGAGMHAHVVIDLLFDLGHKPIAMLDKSKNNTSYRGIDSITEDEISIDGEFFIVAVGDNRLRALLINRYLKNGGLLIPALVHPTVVKSPTASIDMGTVVLPGSIIGANTKIGKGAILNSNSVIEHDCKVGDFVHVSVGVILGGDVNVGDLAQIGLGAVVYPGGKVGAKSIVGAGAVVVRDVSPGVRVLGNPAKEA